MTTTTLPRPATVHRILTAPTTAHRVALEAAWGIVTSWVTIAGERKAAATGGILALRRATGQDTVGAVALTIRRTVAATWHDAMDAPADDLGRIALADGVPAGVLDVSRAAALIACSLAGMVDPTDDHAAIIETWWRTHCQRERGTVSVDLGPVDIIDPPHALGRLIESMIRWPGEPTPLCQSLDQIAGEVLRDPTATPPQPPKPLPAPVSIRDAVREAVRRAGITPEELARMASDAYGDDAPDRSHVYKYLSGTSDMTSARAGCLMAALGLTISR